MKVKIFMPCYNSQDHTKLAELLLKTTHTVLGVKHRTSSFSTEGDLTDRSGQISIRDQVNPD